jgi:uncharacterized protein (TIGR02679 family)
VTDPRLTDPRLLEWSRLPGPRKVLAAARGRLEAGHGMSGRPLRVPLTPAERDQVGNLLGMTWARSGRPVGVKLLAEAVGSLDSDVESLLTALGGPLQDLRGDRASARQRAADEREAARRILVAAGVPHDTADGWPSRRGLPQAGTGQLLKLAEDCARVWRQLPADDEKSVLLTVLAASAIGDPHALDRNTTLAVNVLRLLGHELEGSADEWRSVWELHGVVCDPVSSRVLVLNLSLTGDAACARLASAAGAEPLWLTWRSLSGSFGCADPEVYICENPSVLIAAADELGIRSRPLVCTNGHPSAAALRLLSGLAADGATLHVRADDDAAGQDIVARIQAAIPAVRLWHYTLRPSDVRRFEEQDLPLLLLDLTITE